MDDVVVGQQLESLGDVQYDLPEFILVVPDGGIELFVVDAIHLLVVVLFALEFVESVAQGVSAFLVQYPGVFFVYEIVIQLHQMLDARTGREFLLGGASEVEEVGAEPDFLDVGLVAAFGDDLFDGVLLFALLVFPQPHERKPSSSQQFDLVEAIGEAISEDFYFFLAEVIGILLLFFPFKFNLLERLLPIGFYSFGAVLEGDGVFGGAFFLREFILLSRESFGLFEASLLVLLFLECVLQFALLAVGVEFLLVSQLEVLQTFRDVFLEGCFLDSGPVRFVGFAETVVFAAVRGLILFQRRVFDLICFRKKVQRSAPKLSFFRLRFLVSVNCLPLSLLLPLVSLSSLLRLFCRMNFWKGDLVLATSSTSVRTLPRSWLVLTILNLELVS